MNKLKKLVGLFLLVAILVPSVALGAVSVYTPSPNTSAITTIDGTSNSIISKIASIAGIIYTLLFVVAVIFLLMAAFSYLTSAGDPGKVKKASAQLIYAIVAIVVGVLAFSITKIVEQFLVK